MTTQAVKEEVFMNRYGKQCTHCGLVRYWSEFRRLGSGWADVCTPCQVDIDDEARGSNLTWFRDKEK